MLRIGFFEDWISMSGTQAGEQAAHWAAWPILLVFATFLAASYVCLPWRWCAMLVLLVLIAASVGPAAASEIDPWGHPTVEARSPNGGWTPPYAQQYAGNRAVRSGTNYQRPTGVPPRYAPARQTPVDAPWLEAGPNGAANRSPQPTFDRRSAAMRYDAPYGTTRWPRDASYGDDGGLAVSRRAIDDPSLYRRGWEEISCRPEWSPQPGGFNGPCTPMSMQDRCWALGGETCAQASRLWTDIKHYYECDTMLKFGLVLGGGAILANTAMDRNFQNWYQDDVRSGGTDNFASFWKTFGEGHIFIPAFACLGAAGAMMPDCRTGNFLADFGFRMTRAYLVGAPPMVFMQYALGASRPGETSHHSRWVFFDDTNSVSGHAFTGAVPFITLAQMTDNCWLKGGLYICSALPAWSRLNDDAHYASQCILGWYMAYMACSAITKTDLECEPKCYAFAPVVTPEMQGVAFAVRW